MIVDSLCFLGDCLFSGAPRVDDLLRRLDEAETDRAIVAPFRPRDYHLGPANDALAATVEAHADRLVGFARVDPNRGGEAVAELERAVGQLGLRGLFLNPWEETFRVNAPFVDPLLEAAARLRVPVIVAAGFPWLSEGLQVGDLARRHPDVTVVGTNGLQINISGLGQTDAELALGQNENLVLQTAGVYREDFIEGVAERLGAGRVLYASAWPYFDPRLERRRVDWCHLDESAKAQILGGNAERLLLRS